MILSILVSMIISAIIAVHMTSFSILTIAKIKGCKFKEVKFYEWNLTLCFVIPFAIIICLNVNPIVLDFINRFM